MARNKPHPGLADYVAIALAPALIIVLVVSLVFFLLEVSYAGQFTTRLHWIFFFFVVAAPSVVAARKMRITAIAMRFILVSLIESMFGREDANRIDGRGGLETAARVFMVVGDDAAALQPDGSRRLSGRGNNKGNAAAHLE